jgi:hypothetical protein
MEQPFYPTSLIIRIRLIFCSKNVFLGVFLFKKTPKPTRPARPMRRSTAYGLPLSCFHFIFALSREQAWRSDAW